MPRFHTLKIAFEEYMVEKVIFDLEQRKMGHVVHLTPKISHSINHHDA
jgi:hypothetical protein